MESATKIFFLDHYQIKLSKPGGRLLIKLKVIPLQKSFSIELDNDGVIQASKETFAHVEAMYQGLEEALNKYYKEVSISFDDSGKLEYRVSLSLGAFKEERGFTIFLQEQDQNAMTVVADRENIANGRPENMMVNQQFSALMEMMSRLETKMLEKFDVMEKRITALEQSKAERSEQQKTEINMEFNPLDTHASSFVFGNNNKTIKRIAKDYCELAIAKSIPDYGKLAMSFLIEKTQDGVWIGIVPIAQMDLAHWFKSGIRYLTTNGCTEKTERGFKNFQKPRPSSEGYGKTGDVISMILDIDHGKITFNINDYEVNSISVDMKAESYFPFIGVAGIKDEVSFLSALHTIN